MTELSPEYTNSHALIIGIDKYESARPLYFAVNDARAVADSVKRHFGFKHENVKLLLNEEATQEEIQRQYLRFGGFATERNDRLLVYYAGHGCTLPTTTGLAGFLVPFNGATDDISTLVRWDMFTKNSDLIQAKHILFVMDACYGGHAIKRALEPGASRFLKNMLTRECRQVITAGKADEVVADAGGPRRGHSVFTGHFLDAIEGAAEQNEVITANGVMGYVYAHVGMDLSSEQTPHFGYLSGDGDFIFKLPRADDVLKSDEADPGIIISLPTPADPNKVLAENPVEIAKALLSSEQQRIRFNELMTVQARQLVSVLGADGLSTRGEWNNSEVDRRLGAYNSATDSLVELAILSGQWASDVHLPSVTLPFKRISEIAADENGVQGYVHLRMYPLVRLVYAYGLGAVAGANWGPFASVLKTPVAQSRIRKLNASIASVVGRCFELNEIIKVIPEFSRNYTPLSEYLFANLQPFADDILYCGSDYESMFDTVELLIFFEGRQQVGQARPGRFGWKQRSSAGASPLDEFLMQGRTNGASWQVLKSGFFAGSAEVFEAEAKRAIVDIGKLSWW